MHIRLTLLLPATAGRVRTHTSDPTDESTTTRQEDHRVIDTNEDIPEGVSGISSGSKSGSGTKK
ncbi:hypothetical protein [Amycolatopsis saalfeldensis]|nr:hypothetical protein [Amycolatopsis saalfeldensis]